MKKKISMLFVIVMILMCMPVMAGTVSSGAAAAETTTATVQSVKNGWIQSGSNWRFYVNGKLRKNGVYKIGNYYYGFDSKGNLLKGFFTINNKTYYGSTQFGPSNKPAIKYGIVLTGYYKVGNYYYYFNPSKKGQMAKGFIKIGKKLYYFDSSTGRQRREKGWFYVGNAMYYVMADGTIATNTTIDGYKIGPTGAVTDVYGMDKKAQGYSSNTRYLILVNKGKHVVNIYKGSKGSWAAVKRGCACTIGKSSTPTPSGKFRLDHKSSRAYGYKDFKGSTVFYTTRISAGNYFHSILYRKGCRNPYTSSPKDSTLGKNKSNSCIRLALENAKYIHQSVPTNTRVVVY